MATTEYPPSPYIEEIEQSSPYFEAIEKLLKEDYKRFFSLGTAMTGNYEDGEDVVQEVLMNLLARGDKPADFMEDPVRYLCGAIIKKSQEFFRKKVRRRIDYNIRVEDLDRPQLEPMADDPMIERLRKAMEILDPYWSEMLMLRYGGELTLDEIAAKLGKNQIAVGVQLHRARAKLRFLMLNPNSWRGRGRPSKMIPALRKAGRRFNQILNEPGSWV
jgi:RNA polymerase sigma factor (sigma-70 family)